MKQKKNGVKIQKKQNSPPIKFAKKRSWENGGWAFEKYTGYFP